MFDISKGLTRRDLSNEYMAKKAVALIYSNNIFENIRPGVIWFLTCLFMTEVLFFLIQRFITMGLVRIIVIIALGICGLSWKYVINFLPPFYINIALTALLFYSLGYFLRGILQKKGTINEAIIGIALLIIGSLTGIYNTVSLNGNNVDMYFMRYGNLIFFVTSASLCTIGLFSIFHAIGNHFEESRIKLLTYVGENSLIIFLLHGTIIQILQYFINRIGIMHDAWVVLSILTLLCSMLCAVIINKYFHKVIYLR